LRKQCGGTRQDAFHIACFWSGFEVFAVQSLFLQAKQLPNFSLLRAFDGNLAIANPFSGQSAT